jgi:PAS domain S-box-containing protein
VSAVVITVHDISERPPATGELERSDARLRDSERMIGVGSWEVGVEDRKITYSAGFGRVVGLSPDEPLSVADYQAMVHRDDRGIFAAAFASCLRDGSASCEYRIVRRDGSERRLASHGETLLDDNGGVGFVRGAVLDVTEQRASERQRLAAMDLFEQAFNAAPIGMTLSTLDGRYIRVNDAMCSLLGRSRSELMRLGVDDVTHPDDRLADEKARRAMHENDVADYHGQKRYVCSDGTIVWAAVHTGPVRGVDGKIEAFFAQMIDITEARIAKPSWRSTWGTPSGWGGSVTRWTETGSCSTGSRSSIFAPVKPSNANCCFACGARTARSSPRTSSWPWPSATVWSRRSTAG